MIKYAFFGSSRFSALALAELERLGVLPSCVVTTPDKPVGRKLIMTPTPVKEWALQRGIRVYDPARLDASFGELLRSEGCEVFIVASYGKILPVHIIDIPSRKTINIHPSLLPQYRGPAPLQASILDDTKDTGVTIMQIDEQVDHGPIIAQEKVTISEWPTYEDFEALMATKGARLLHSILNGWVAGSIKAADQDHSAATFTKKVTKEDGLIDLSADPYTNFRKIQAYHEWPQAYFMFDHKGKKIRVKVTTASFASGNLIIEKVIPEGSKEMDYASFRRGFSN